MALKIAISSQKGGVAKTTTSLSLGACLAEQGQRVLLIDLDPQANLTQSLGINPEQMRHTIGDVLLDRVTLLSASRESPVFNLDLVPANSGLLILDKILYGRPGYEYRLQTHVQLGNGDYYDAIVFDCPPSFGTLTLNALTAADVLIIPVPAEYYAMHSLRKYLDLIRLVHCKSNPKLTYRLLVTMFDRRSRIGEIILEQLRRDYRNTLFDTLIPVDVKLRESPIFCKPITQYAPKTRGAEGYRALAMELMTHG